MFNIAVIEGIKSKSISHQVGQTLLETLRGADIKIRTGCQEMGACGLCTVFIRNGISSPITATEELQLGHRLSLGMRLACQVIPQGDLVVELISQGNKVLANTQSDETQLKYPSERTSHTHGCGSGYGIAVDIGTTNVSIAVFNWENGRQLATLTFSNPQHEYGTDVITRMLKAAEDVSVAKDLQKKVIHKINENIQKLVHGMGISMEEIADVGVVGNTAMLALFHGDGYQKLLDPQYWGKTLLFQKADIKAITEIFHLRQDTSITIVDPLAGFVGSDLLAGITGIRMLDKEAGTLFLDFGTNTEIALWDGNLVWVTAASGGPAFEGCGMSCGSAAIPGAIFQAHSSSNAEIPFATLTIEGRDATGICGSGYVDIIGTLLTMDLLDSIGRFSGKMKSDQEIVIMESPLIKITKKDIDGFQRAKAAVAAGIRILLLRAGMFSVDISQVYITGNFGKFLDVTNAQHIGLLPSIDSGKICICENAVLQGCREIMLYGEAKEMLGKIREKANYINLAYDSEFESAFMESLFLKPY